MLAAAALLQLYSTSCFLQECTGTCAVQVCAVPAPSSACKLHRKKEKMFNTYLARMGVKASWFVCKPTPIAVCCSSSAPYAMSSRSVGRAAFPRAYFQQPYPPRSPAPKTSDRTSSPDSLVGGMLSTFSSRALRAQAGFGPRYSQSKHNKLSTGRAVRCWALPLRDQQGN